VSFIIDGNKQEGKRLVVKHNILKLVKVIMPLPRDHLDGFSWQMGSL
jgi:hypothetical protein